MSTMLYLGQWFLSFSTLLHKHDIIFPSKFVVLPYKVKTQYVQVSNIADTSIKHPISGQSTPMVKGFKDMFDMVLW